MVQFNLILIISIYCLPMALSTPVANITGTSSSTERDPYNQHQDCCTIQLKTDLKVNGVYTVYPYTNRPNTSIQVIKLNWTSQVPNTMQVGNFYLFRFSVTLKQMAEVGQYFKGVKKLAVRLKDFSGIGKAMKPDLEILSCPIGLVNLFTFLSYVTFLT